MKHNQVRRVCVLAKHRQVAPSLIPNDGDQPTSPRLERKGGAGGGGGASGVGATGARGIVGLGEDMLSFAKRCRDQKQLLGE